MMSRKGLEEKTGQGTRKEWKEFAPPCGRALPFDQRRHRTFRHALQAAAAPLGGDHGRMFPVAGCFEGEEPFPAGGHAAAAAGAALRIDGDGVTGCVHQIVFINGELEWERKLLPGATLDPGAGVVAGAGGYNHRRRLFAGPAAGEAELVVYGVRFHGCKPSGARRAVPLPERYASFLIQPN